MVDSEDLVRETLAEPKSPGKWVPALKRTYSGLHWGAVGGLLDQAPSPLCSFLASLGLLNLSVSRIAAVTSLSPYLALQFSLWPATPAPLPDYSCLNISCGMCVRAQLCFCLAVSHRPGAFKAELSKLVIVAKAARSEL